MLNTATETQRPNLLQRLSAAPVHFRDTDIDWQTPIDRSRWFLCETATPLYYTSIYRDLDVEHRRRYNQLTAMMTNEIIAFMETEFLVSMLTAVSAARNTGQSEDLRVAVMRFAEEERRHAEMWWKLNRLSEPKWYDGVRWRLINLPPGVRSTARMVARHPIALPLVFWLQLVQEERSLDLSRRCMRMPRASIEPRYLAAYSAHLPDEARHVQIDRYLIDRYYLRRRPLVRHLSARLFIHVVRTLLVAPVHSTGRVVRILVTEFPGIKSFLPEMLRQLRALRHNTDYHAMMYSRRTTPVTFALFDRCPEFHSMRNVLLAYQPSLTGEACE